jgi:hypothetical protein
MNPVIHVKSSRVDLDAAGNRCAIIVFTDGSEVSTPVPHHVIINHPAHVTRDSLIASLNFCESRLRDLIAQIDRAEKAIAAAKPSERKYEQARWALLDIWKSNHASIVGRHARDTRILEILNRHLFA